MKKSRIENTLDQLYSESKKDIFLVLKGFLKSLFRPIRPEDLKHAFLSISKEQGRELTNLVIEKDYKNIVEFGTSFGISTLFLAQGILNTGGKILTTELIESKAKRAKENFKEAGVEELIEVRIGNALDTLKDYKEPIDLLFLDGWKELYLPIFQLFEDKFHKKTTIYVDNANMKDTRKFLEVVGLSPQYHVTFKYNKKVALITRA